MKVMFDTNVFSNIAQGTIDPETIPADWEPVATHIQWDEIQQTKDPSIRSKIAAIFSDYLSEITPTASTVWGVSKWGESRWTGPTSVYQSFVEQLDKERPHRNNPKDSLIADTCFQMGMALVTNDRPLIRVAQRNNIETFNLEGP